MSLKKRVERLEKVSQPVGWSVSILDARDFASEEELSQAVERLRGEALAAGWKPEQGIFVAVFCGVNDETE